MKGLSVLELELDVAAECRPVAGTDAAADGLGRAAAGAAAGAAVLVGLGAPRRCAVSRNALFTSIAPNSIAPNFSSGECQSRS